MKTRVSFLFSLAAIACGGAAPEAAAPPATPAQTATSAPAPSADPPETTDPGADAPTTTNGRILAKFRRALGTVPPGALPGRLVVVDIAYPSSKTEFEAMGGFTLMLLSAVAHDPNELPFKRAFLRSGQNTQDLRAVKTRQTVLPASETQVGKVFGQHRFDALYLLPIRATRLRGDVVVDFATKRSNFRVWSFPAPNASRALPPNIDLEAEPRTPDPNAVRMMAQREFPVFSELP